MILKWKNLFFEIASRMSHTIFINTWKWKHLTYSNIYLYLKKAKTWKLLCAVNILNCVSVHNVLYSYYQVWMQINDVYASKHTVKRGVTSAWNSKSLCDDWALQDNSFNVEFNFHYENFFLIECALCSLICMAHWWYNSQLDYAKTHISLGWQIASQLNSSNMLHSNLY